MIFPLSVIHRICQKDRCQNRKHPVCRKDEKSGNKQEKHSFHIGKCQNQQYDISCNRHGKADIKYPDGAECLAQQWEKQHHGKNLDGAAKHIEQSVGIVPALPSKIIFEEVNDQIGSDVNRAVNQYNGNDHCHRLVILKQRPKHLPD